MNVVEQLRALEGVVPHAYQDHLGFWTIGVGRMIDKRKGGGLSTDEIEYLLANDVRRIRAALSKELPWVGRLNEARQAVLIGMAFQMGVEGLLEFKQTLRAVEDEQWETAAAQMLRSKWAQQTPKRAHLMSRQMATGEWQT